MIDLIGENEFYRIQIDKGRNRLFILLMGLWKNEQKDVPDWMKHFTEAVTTLKPGFSALVDLTKMTGTVVPDAFARAQVVALENGIAKVAEIHRHGSFVEAQVRKVSTESGLPIARFYDREEAIIWLDGQ